MFKSDIQQLAMTFEINYDRSHKTSFANKQIRRVTKTTTVAATAELKSDHQDVSFTWLGLYTIISNPSGKGTVMRRNLFSGCWTKARRS